VTSAQAYEAERIQHRYGRIATREHDGLLIVSVFGDAPGPLPSKILTLGECGRIVHREVHEKPTAVLDDLDEEIVAKLQAQPDEWFRVSFLAPILGARPRRVQEGLRRAVDLGLVEREGARVRACEQVMA
jgi:hypothetical protein